VPESIAILGFKWTEFQSFRTQESLDVHLDCHVRSLLLWMIITGGPQPAGGSTGGRIPTYPPISSVGWYHRSGFASACRLTASSLPEAS